MIYVDVDSYWPFQLDNENNKYLSTIKCSITS